MNDVSNLAIPKTGLAGLRENWVSDLTSGFLVFLIALPLCLGIAMASGFPPMAGIISAVIGGLLVSRISGSYVTINGPAAGLIVVILDAVQTLGEGDMMAGYRYTLAAIVVASILQIVMGLMKAGKLSAFFPASVVHGMLAAIGIIIMAKQFHTMFGVKPEAESLFGAIAEIPQTILDMNPEVALIGVSGLFIMIVWSLMDNRFVKMIPAPILVVLVGMGLGQIFNLDMEHHYLILPDAEWLPHHDFTIGPRFLVSVPENFLDSFYFPDFAKIASVEFWIAVISICLVGSLESLLSAAAVDKLDPYKRYSDLNRDLSAVGAGNTISGAIGGLPMIAEIVRSSANVNNGARTGWSNFFHGAFLLLFVALFPRIIHEIPMASLAALLVYTGYRLAAPREFLKTLSVGLDNFAIFVITILGVLATDLLIGVAIGIAAKTLIHIYRGVKLKNFLSMAYHVHQTDDDTYHIQVSGAAIFSNLLGLKSELAELPKRKTIYFDLTEADLIDHTVMEFMHDFAEDYRRNGGKCEIVGLDDHHVVSDHTHAALIKL